MSPQKLPGGRVTSAIHSTKADELQTQFAGISHHHQRLLSQPPPLEIVTLPLSEVEWGITLAFCFFVFAFCFCGCPSTCTCLSCCHPRRGSAVAVALSSLCRCFQVELGFSPASSLAATRPYRSAEGWSEAQRAKRLSHRRCFCRCIYFSSFLAQKSHVKPQNHLTTQTKQDRIGV